MRSFEELTEKYREFVNLLKEHGMWYKFRCFYEAKRIGEGYISPSHVLIEYSFWYEGTDYRTEGCVVTVSVGAYESHNDAQYKLIERCIEFLKETTNDLQRNQDIPIKRKRH